ncbi:alpha/beta hydrolase [Phenylobacterium sp. LH3H17]|uniref:alpha/beta fold hydrolase n=1 Tax=Phenylobacterium sp. LH3H17 TaxID=2903901 RepID=UPI0020C97835|nr:alpha/beta hydrolase [Phenylobacterium sp. LH3H17]UTP38262.1 alpha/beta hydrolase [Phenylobacterium sp. LH3H17]
MVFRPAAPSERPLVLFIHGAGRHVAGHVRWFDALGDEVEVVLAELPGHGLAPWLSRTDVEAWTDAFEEAIAATFPRRPFVAVGESLGGLLAMGLAGAARIVAFDPPLRTGELWPIHRDPALLSALTPAFWSNIFGAGPGSRDIDYRSRVSARRAPLSIVTGDMPLGAPRPLPTPPAFLDPEDRGLCEAIPGVSVVVIPGAGHALLDHHAEACFRLVAREVSAFRSAQAPSRPTRPIRPRHPGSARPGSGPGRPAPPG